MFNTSYQISQNVILLQETRAATADNLKYMTPPGPRGLAQLSTLLHAKPTSSRAQTHTRGRTRTPGHAPTRTQTLVADNSHPVIFDCGPFMLDQRHLTHSSVGLGPPGAPLPPARDCQGVTSALQNKHRNLSA